MQRQKLQILMTILKLSTMQSLKRHLVNSIKIDVKNPQSPLHACAHELTGLRA